MGYIYILTNPSFPEYVKIGYAKDVKKRLDQLNHAETIPFAFRVYATYEVKDALTDKEVHRLIDKLNPELRSIEEFEGKKRVREFYLMTPEDAYSILESVAKISGTTSKLKKYTPTKDEKSDSLEANKNKVAKAIDFTTLGIKPGAKLELWHHGKKHLECEVYDNKKIIYKDEVMSLTGLVRKEFNIKTPAGPDYFKYNGRWLNDIRREKGEINW